MTCKEKLQEMHPEWDRSRFKVTVDNSCPSDHGIMSDPESCFANGCAKCWDRTVSETETSTPNDTVAKTLDTDVKCDSCVHAAVCAYREDLTKIMKTFDNGYDSCCSIDNIYRNTSEYLKITISCKHYKRKVEVVHR